MKGNANYTPHISLLVGAVGFRGIWPVAKKILFVVMNVSYALLIGIKCT